MQTFVPDSGTGDEYKVPTGDEYKEPTGDKYPVPGFKADGTMDGSVTGDEYTAPTGDEGEKGGKDFLLSFVLLCV